MDPRFVRLAGKLAAKMAAQRWRRDDVTPRDIWRYFRLDREQRSVVRAGGVPRVLVNSPNAVWLVRESLAYLDTTQNQSRSAQIRAAIRLAFGSKAFDRVIAQREDDVRRAAIAAAPRLRDYQELERGVYQWSEARVVASVLKPGQFLTIRLVLEHEEEQAIIDQLWVELENTSPDQQPHLRLVR